MRTTALTALRRVDAGGAAAAARPLRRLASRPSTRPPPQAGASHTPPPWYTSRGGGGSAPGTPPPSPVAASARPPSPSTGAPAPRGWPTAADAAYPPLAVLEDEMARLTHAVLTGKAAPASLARVIDLWALYQRGPYPPFSPRACSSIITAYSKLGAHLLAVTLYLAFPRVAWKQRALVAIKRSAQQVGHVDAFVDALRRQEAAAVPVSVADLEALATTCIRGREFVRAAAVLAQIEHAAATAATGSQSGRPATPAADAAGSDVDAADGDGQPAASDGRRGGPASPLPASAVRGGGGVSHALHSELVTTALALGDADRASRALLAVATALTTDATLRPVVTARAAALAAAAARLTSPGLPSPARAAPAPAPPHHHARQRAGQAGVGKGGDAAAAAAPPTLPEWLAKRTADQLGRVVAATARQGDVDGATRAVVAALRMGEIPTAADGELLLATAATFGHPLLAEAALASLLLQRQREGGVAGAARGRVGGGPASGGDAGTATAQASGSDTRDDTGLPLRWWRWLVCAYARGDDLLGTVRALQLAELVGPGAGRVLADEGVVAVVSEAMIAVMGRMVVIAKEARRVEEDARRMEEEAPHADVLRSDGGAGNGEGVAPESRGATAAAAEDGAVDARVSLSESEDEGAGKGAGGAGDGSAADFIAGADEALPAANEGSGDGDAAAAVAAPLLPPPSSVLSNDGCDLPFLLTAYRHHKQWLLREALAAGMDAVTLLLTVAVNGAEDAARLSVSWQSAMTDHIISLAAAPAPRGAGDEMDGWQSWSERMHLQRMGEGVFLRGTTLQAVLASHADFARGWRPEPAPASSSSMDVRLSTPVFNALLGALGASRFNNLVGPILQLGVEHGIVPDGDTYAAVLARYTCPPFLDIPSARQVVALTEAHTGEPPNAATYAQLVTLMARAGKPRAALQLAQRAVSEGHAMSGEALQRLAWATVQQLLVKRNAEAGPAPPRVAVGTADADADVAIPPFYIDGVEPLMLSAATAARSATAAARGGGDSGEGRADSTEQDATETPMDAAACADLLRLCDNSGTALADATRKLLSDPAATMQQQTQTAPIVVYAGGSTTPHRSGGPGMRSGDGGGSRSTPRGAWREERGGRDAGRGRDERSQAGGGARDRRRVVPSTDADASGGHPPRRSSARHAEPLA